jgi:L-threonylcarbamoyladenylate synthase
LKQPLRSKDPKILHIDPEHPQPEGIAEASGVLSKGGVIIFPTLTLYGLGVDAFNARAVNTLFEIKGRPTDKPILILICDISQLNSLAREVPAAAKLLMNRFWPGRLTLVFHAKKGLPKSLIAQKGKIGIRLTGNRVAASLVTGLGRPVTGTSANLSGQPGAFRISDLDPSLKTRVDMILDAGTLKGGVGSTIIDITFDSPKILREGEISASEIYEALGSKPVNALQSP